MRKPSRADAAAQPDDEDDDEDDDDEDRADGDSDGDDSDGEIKAFCRLLTCLHNDRETHMVSGGGGGGPEDGSDPLVLMGPGGGVAQSDDEDGDEAPALVPLVCLLCWRPWGLPVAWMGGLHGSRSLGVRDRCAVHARLQVPSCGDPLLAAVRVV